MPALLRFAAKRLLSAAVVLFAISVLTFLIFFAVPGGDPAKRIAGRTANADTIRLVRETYGFDQPLWVQYGRMMKEILTGQVESYTQRLNVFGEIRRGLPATLSLAVGGAVLWLLAGVVLGTVAALLAGRAADRVISLLNFAAIAAPEFVVGGLLLIVFSFSLDLLPSAGYVPLTQDPVAWALHLLLPWVTLSLVHAAVYAQVLRDTLLEALGSDAVRTARAKGLSRPRVVVRHALRVSLLPIASLWGLDAAAVIGGGTLVVEKVFSLGGIGQFTADATGALDVPPVLVMTMLSAFAVVLMNAFVDVLYVGLDPRTRSGVVGVAR